MTITLTSAALIATASPLTPMHLSQITVQSELMALASSDLNEVVDPAPADPDSAVPSRDAPLDTPAGEASEEVVPDAEAQSEDVPAGENVIIVSQDSEARKKDPLVQVNETAFQVTQAVDAAFVEPIADVYEEDLPSPIRKGLRNFFRNLLEPITALNYFLQLKPGKAFETLGRFTLNTTIGVGGLFDVAKKEPFNLPYRRNGFANTLGYYGVGPGPFLVLPLVGATTLRDFIGGGVDQSIIPFAIGKPFNSPLYAIPAYTVNSLEFRINFDEQITAINESDDPYFAMREIYLCQREADIAALKNRPPPRDCRIEAIMGLEPGTAERLTLPEQQLASEAESESTMTQGADMAPDPAPPAIVYVRNPVIQPLPGDYVPAPSPSN